jgi:hypothetical protein
MGQDGIATWDRNRQGHPLQISIVFIFLGGGHSKERFG